MPLALHSRYHIRNCRDIIFIMKSDNLTKEQWPFNSYSDKNHISEIPRTALSGAHRQKRWWSCDQPSRQTERSGEPGTSFSSITDVGNHHSQGTWVSASAQCPQAQGTGQDRTAEIAWDAEMFLMPQNGVTVTDGQKPTWPEQINLIRCWKHQMITFYFTTI